jgi:hypothetical protein
MVVKYISKKMTSFWFSHIYLGLRLTTLSFVYKIYGFHLSYQVTSVQKDLRSNDLVFTLVSVDVSAVKYRVFIKMYPQSVEESIVNAPPIRLINKQFINNMR